MECPHCQHDVRSFERHCPVCNTDAGYPNVRAAEEAPERAALAHRFAGARDHCQQHGTAAVLEQFLTALRHSTPVICRSLQQVLGLVSSDNELYASFYGQRQGGVRRPDDSAIERERLIADDLLFPYYKEEIRFAALSLSEDGVRYYGDCSLVLTEFAVANRTTVFEQNSVDFCKARKLGAATPLPPGYRAIWQSRDELGAAKLHAQLGPDSNQATFRRLLIANGESAGADFIEVHIFGPLHRRSISSITVPEPRNPVDEALTLQIEHRAREVDAQVVRRG
jgi:hypothetical protein